MSGQQPEKSVIQVEAPLITMVTPFHNTAEYLAECIQGVSSHHFPDIDYVLPDNASTDGSTDIARQFAAMIFESGCFAATISCHKWRITTVPLGSFHPRHRTARSFERTTDFCRERSHRWWTSRSAPSGRHRHLVLLDGVNLRGVGLPLDQERLTGSEACRLHFCLMVHRFGNRFLAPQEVERAVAWTEPNYLRFLALVMHQFRPRVFWPTMFDNLRKDRLWTLRTRTRVAGYFGQVIDVLLNVKSTAGRLVRFIQGRATR